MEKTRVGVVGCGNISDIYFTNLPRFAALSVTACADLDPARAAAKAAQYGVRALEVAALLNDPAMAGARQLDSADRRDPYVAAPKIEA